MLFYTSEAPRLSTDLLIDQHQVFGCRLVMRPGKVRLVDVCQHLEIMIFALNLGDGDGRWEMGMGGCILVGVAVQCNSYESATLWIEVIC